MTEHGGRLRTAALAHGIPLSDWLDLSTGINPRGWPVPELPPACWQRLPEDEDDLPAVAARYYGAASILPVAGSQGAIATLPRLRPSCRVGVYRPAYAEHARAWARCGHTLVPWQADDDVEALDVLVLINPNNPDGRRWPLSLLRRWQRQLARRGGWLVVDEAFMDTSPEHSLAPDAHQPGLIVLRSLGKFFGLAGARVGFALAEASLLARLDAELGPWCIAGPARWVAARALADRPRQQQTLAELARSSRRLAALLAGHGLSPAGGTALFQYCPTPRARMLQRQLAGRAILVRAFDEPPALRFGLPGGEAHWLRLETALATLTP